MTSSRPSITPGKSRHQPDDISTADESTLANAQTMAVTTIVMFQIFYMLSCRSLRDSILRIGVFSNPAMFIGIATIVALQLAFIYAPFMQQVFGTAALAAHKLALTALAAVIILPVIGLEKRRNMTEPRRVRSGTQPS